MPLGKFGECIVDAVQLSLVKPFFYELSFYLHHLRSFERNECDRKASQRHALACHTKALEELHRSLRGLESLISLLAVRVIYIIVIETFLLQEASEFTQS